VHDEYVRYNGARVRVRKEEGKLKNIIEKTPLLHMDVEAGFGVRLRMSARSENIVQFSPKHKISLAAPESVRISARRRFCIASKNIVGVSWNFEVMRVWLGPSTASVEYAMSTQDVKDTVTTAPPAASCKTIVEIEVELPWDKDSPSKLPPDAMLLTCLGLLLKARDVLVLLGKPKDSTFSLLQIIQDNI
jgi:hypothetical protein